MADLLMIAKPIPLPVPRPEHIEPIIQTLITYTGVPLMTAIISSAVALLIGGGLGWYIKGRGMAGVQIDLTNSKNEIEKLNAQISKTATAAATAVHSA